MHFGAQAELQLRPLYHRGCLARCSTLWMVNDHSLPYSSFKVNIMTLYDLELKTQSLLINYITQNYFGWTQICIEPGYRLINVTPFPLPSAFSLPSQPQGQTVCNVDGCSTCGQVASIHHCYTRWQLHSHLTGQWWTIIDRHSERRQQDSVVQHVVSVTGMMGTQGTTITR